MSAIVLGRPTRARLRIKRRGLAGLGDMGEQYTPDKFLADINKVIADLVETLMREQQTHGTLARLLDTELVRAHQFQTTGLAPSTLAVKVAALQRARDAAHLAYVIDPNSVATLPNRQAAAQAAGDVLRWYAGVTGQALKESNARAATVTDILSAIKSAPAAVLGWTLESLGLPKWILPVGLVVVGLVVLQTSTGVLGNLGGALKAVKGHASA